MKSNKRMTPFVLLVVVLILSACTATEAAPTATVEVPAAPTETAVPTETEPPAPTDPATPEPEPTATQIPYPGARTYHSMVYDPVADVTILFSGFKGNWQFFGDIWAYETGTNTWIQAGSIRKDWFVSTYHSGARQAVLYTGATTRGESLISKGKTRTYDYSTNTTESLEADGTPFGYIAAQLAYDEESDVVILFGGGDSVLELFDDTFAYDLNTNTWTNMAPTTKPPGMYFHSMVYHPTIDRVVLFGGLIFGSERNNETWMYDYNTNTWELVPVSNAPSGRAYSAMVYVSSIDKLILFGGVTKEAGIVNDLWAFDHIENTWIELQPDIAPGARQDHAMAYDSNADKIILFGGDSADSEPLNDTWIYDPQTNTWAEMTPGN